MERKEGEKVFNMGPNNAVSDPFSNACARMGRRSAPQASASASSGLRVPPAATFSTCV